MFEVQHYTLCDGWVNTWLDCEDNPIRYRTYAEARRDLDKFLDDTQADYEDGHLYSPEDSEDYRIVSVGGNDHVHPTIARALPW
jgi:hypothetical protein